MAEPLLSSMSHHRRRWRTIQDWAPALAVSALLAWVTIGMLLAMHLSLFDGSKQPTSGPLLQEADSAGAQGLATTRLLHQAASRGAAPVHTAASASNQASATVMEPGAISSKEPAGILTGSTAAGGISNQAEAHTSRSRPLPASDQPASILPDHPRLSRWAENLTDAELHGGWNLTWEVFDHATKHPNATVLSWASPRVLLIRDFLQPDEIEHLVQQATGNFMRSEVVADASKQHSARTSYGAWLNGAKRDAKVHELQHRIHDLVGIPEAFGESLYVLQYENGQKYDPHTDHCTTTPGVPSSQSCREFMQRAGGPKCGPGGGGVTCGDRLATFILYLRSPTKGGTTVFPYATGHRQHQQQQERVVEATAEANHGIGRPGSGSSHEVTSGADSRRILRYGNGMPSSGVEVPSYCLEGADQLQVAPGPGSAVFFWDYTPSWTMTQPGELAVPDPTSLHGGCPVLEGTKLIATRWIRAAEFH